MFPIKNLWAYGILFKIEEEKKMDSRNDNYNSNSGGNKLKNIAVLIFKSFKQMFILPRVNWCIK